ncbi:cytochrome P450 2K1-like isoform X7 [Brachyhypopomus gauderio]|uniref:cytochrome P450 2K1-like isoform X7 n=1 Tax=Brachyhypopomus gauderio TaxID=698409 RepID=UPI0040422F47
MGGVSKEHSVESCSGTDIMLGSFVLVGICIFIFIVIRIQRPKNFPPGPQPVPIFGNLLQLNILNPLKDLERLAECYGNVYSLYIGRNPAVVLTGFKAVKEALVTNAADFSGRPQNLMVNSIIQKTGFIFADYGSAWREHRRFALMTLRNFGLGKQSMEKRILGEIEHLVARLEKSADLHVAGTDTTSNTLLTAFLYLMAHPHIQERCRQEIDEVLEGKAQASFEDRHNMPYTQAVIHESQRVANTVPLSVFHSTSRDTQLMGYSIPKGTLIIPNLSSVLSEEDQWKFPHEFNPANFLNDQGQFEKPEAFLPFSAGPRVCLGEGLARMELFLILVSLLRRFQFVWPEDAGEPDFTPVFGITLTPRPYKMGVRLRQKPGEMQKQ